MKKFCFIYNPAANRSTSFHTFSRLKQIVGQWEQSEVLVSKSKGDISELSRRASHQFDVVVACGGDGTIREVALGLLGTSAILGVVPLGSGNDFSKNLNLSGRLRDTVQILKEGRTREIDVGRCNDHYFLNTMGIGFDGLTNFYADHSILPGSLKYTWGALKAKINLEPMNVTLSTEQGIESLPLLMITLANGRIEGGSFKVAPAARIDDGKLDIVTVGPVSGISFPFLLLLFLTGRQKVHKAVKTFNTDRLQIMLDKPTYLHADGEVIETSETDFEVQLLPSALTVIGNFE